MSREWLDSRPLMRIADIASGVAALTGISVAELRGQSKEQHIADARHYAFWLCRENKMSYSFIGKYFNRDHSTVMYGVTRVKKGS